MAGSRESSRCPKLKADVEDVVRTHMVFAPIFGSTSQNVAVAR